MRSFDKFANFSRQLQIKIRLLLIIHKPQTIRQRGWSLTALENGSALIHLIKHSNIDSLSSSFHNLNTLLFQKVQPILFPWDLVIGTRMIRIFSTHLQIMPAETRKYNRHQCQLVLITPCHIRFHLNPSISTCLVYRSVSTNSPRVHHIRFQYNIMQ